MSFDKQIELDLSDIESLQESIGWQAFTDDIMDRQRRFLADLETGQLPVNTSNGVMQRPLSNEETWFLRGRLSEHRFILEYITNSKRNEEERLISDGNRNDDSA